MRNNYASCFQFALPRLSWDGNISKSVGEKFIGGRGSKVRRGGGVVWMGGCRPREAARVVFVPSTWVCRTQTAPAEAGETH